MTEAPSKQKQSQQMNEPQANGPEVERYVTLREAHVAFGRNKVLGVTMRRAVFTDGSWYDFAMLQRGSFLREDGKPVRPWYDKRVVIPLEVEALEWLGEQVEALLGLVTRASDEAEAAADVGEAAA